MKEVDGDGEKKQRALLRNQQKEKIRCILFGFVFEHRLHITEKK